MSSSEQQNHSSHHFQILQKKWDLSEGLKDIKPAILVSVSKQSTTVSSIKPKLYFPRYQSLMEVRNIFLTSGLTQTYHQTLSMVYDPLARKYSVKRRGLRSQTLLRIWNCFNVPIMQRSVNIILYYRMPENSGTNFADKRRSLGRYSSLAY
jgi:hypothetical protein